MIELLNMDCMDFMKDKPDKSFDLAIVDPPYGIKYDTYGIKYDRGNSCLVKRQNGTISSIKRKKHLSKKWDQFPPTEKYFNELFRVSKNQIIWGGNYFYLPPSKGIICWDKKQMLPSFSRWEYAWTSFKTISKMFEYDCRGFLEKEYNIHPTQKPIKLYKWLLRNYAKDGDKILDTHGGSMSIAIACHQMNFDLTLCEIDKDYYEAGVKRYNEAIKQQTLFTYET